MDFAHNLLQYLIFALLLSFLLFILWKNAAYRKLLQDIFCCRICSKFSAWLVHYDEADLRTLRELEHPPHRDIVGINGSYRIYQARRSRLSLRLASWREDVKRSGDDDDHQHHKLAQIRAAYNQCHQCLTVAAPASDSTPSANRTVSTPSIPFDIRAVEFTDRVDQLNSSSSLVSDVLNDLDEGSEYELVPNTPRHESLVCDERRSIGITVEEEEEKNNVVP